MVELFPGLLETLQEPAMLLYEVTDAIYDQCRRVISVAHTFVLVQIEISFFGFGLF